MYHATTTTTTTTVFKETQKNIDSFNHQTRSKNILAYLVQTSLQGLSTEVPRNINTRSRGPSIFAKLVLSFSAYDSHL